MLNLVIITPEKTVFQGEVDGVSLPTQLGEITVLPHHEPLIALLESGEMTLMHGARRRHMAIHGGFFEVAHNGIRILTDAAELEEEIDERRAQEALDRARRAKEAAQSEHIQADALAAMERALVRLRISERRKQRHQA